MNLKRELIREIRWADLSEEDKQDLLQQIEEIWALEDGLEKNERSSRKTADSKKGAKPNLTKIRP